MLQHKLIDKCQNLAHASAKGAAAAAAVGILCCCHGHSHAIGAMLPLLEFQHLPKQAKSLCMAALLAERDGKACHCSRIEVLIRASSVHLCLGNSHLKRTNELLFACRAIIALPPIATDTLAELVWELALAVLVRLHNAGYVYKPACTHAC